MNSSSPTTSAATISSTLSARAIRSSMAPMRASQSWRTTSTSSRSFEPK